MTHTETRGHLPRRSFLSSAIAVVAASTLAGGAVVAAAPSASAANGANFTWRNTFEADDAKNGYAALINAVRSGVSSHQVRPEGGRPVHVTDQDGTSQYFTVDLHHSEETQFIRVFMRRSDAYIVGWFTGVDGGDGVIFGDFFPLEPGLRNGQGGIPLGRPAGTLSASDLGSQTIARFQNLANYSNLAQQGASRDNMQISPATLDNALVGLHSAADLEVRLVAPAILQIIVAVAEGSRFRNQAAATAAAFGNGQPYTLTAQHREQHNNWSLMSGALLGAILVGSIALSPEIEVAGIVYQTSAALAAVLMLAHHAGKNTKGKGLLEGSTKLVASDGTGDYWTVQDAINAAPTSGANTIYIDKGVYHEVISVSSSKSWLTIQGVTGNRTDVVIYNSRCNGMINPATGAKYGTQGSAVATFRPPNLTVKDLTISNTFDRNAHPEISPYETQAVAIAAMGDRQVYDNVSIMSHQDTLLCKGETPTTQARQHFVGCFIRGDVDFIFGNATAVIDRSTIQVLPWPGGTVLAPNTDYRKKYGILISSCTITTSGVPNDTMHLGRPWNNTADARPQAVLRDCEIQAGIKDAQPWTNMVPEYPWQWARFKEYRNFGPGAGTGSNAPQMTDAEAADYTAQKYLAGTDGWNPFQ
ncbi:pectinesterase family protein [Streptomyces sp. MB09-02B]|uniref:pectinesterase family protein n=1 Tax=Streptomyces sp. MB09-02B TaxID=3028667 RepID=UPI0029AE5729|nr:pectinesterase family protein [Streptomyces sp. MB09-02B]MDX3641724.1 pectinesterase family protein [Streptomyces sp. MB09-02B]